ncbi:ABC transporter permease [Leptospira idonii]|uniref:FtsX-like permease family protein n=1 Tax=Leptospira idonii TaxID=1193500 RepID=A0A4R9M009_9LEPT|nr:FtsX-like permease family protein [Leptospira idonii]TGN17873.1 FtsX-like permease family protein [Leptospira idonii]
MISIYALFLWGYWKEHKSRIGFSLIGISLGITLYLVTQVNSVRAEQTVLDAQLGYPEGNLIGRFVSNDETKGSPESILKDLYFLVPEEITPIPNLAADGYYETKDKNLKRFVFLGKDILSRADFSNQNTRNLKNKTTFLISASLFRDFFSNKENVEIRLCNRILSLKKEDTTLLERDGSFLVTDIEFAQDLCQMEKRISHIVLSGVSKNPDGFSWKKEDLKRWEESGWIWESERFLKERAGKALGSLKINLTIVSLVSVLISFFMVTNTFTGVYLSRKKEFGILLSLGTGRIHNFSLFLIQALVLGSAGGLLGILFGIFLSKNHFFLSANTVSDLSQTESYTSIPHSILIQSFAIAIIGSLFSSLISAYRSYQVRPIELIRERESSSPPSFRSFAILGAVLIVTGIGLGMIPTPKSLLFGLVGVGSVIVGFVFIFPGFIVTAISVFFYFLKRISFFPSLRLAWEEIKAEPWPNSLTSSTILLSTSLTLTLTALTDSYEKTLIRWVDEENKFDFSIINASELSSGKPGVPISLADRLQQKPKIEAADEFIIRTKFPIHDNFYTLHVYPFPENLDPNRLLVSTNFCYLEKLCQGDELYLPTESSGKRPFLIQGEREHFFSERGTVMMDIHTYKSFYPAEMLNSIRVRFKEEISEEKRKQLIYDYLKSESEDLKVLDRQNLKDLYLEGMRNVFSVLDVLKKAAVFISILALFTSLIYHIREKSKLIAGLRAIGMDQMQVFRMMFFQSLFLILAGLFLGALNSSVLSPLVIYGINRNAFGWILDYSYPVSLLAFWFLFSPFLALLVSIYPTWETLGKTLRESLSYE